MENQGNITFNTSNVMPENINIQPVNSGLLTNIYTESVTNTITDKICNYKFIIIIIIIICTLLYFIYTKYNNKNIINTNSNSDDKQNVLIDQIIEKQNNKIILLDQQLIKQHEAILNIIKQLDEIKMFLNTNNNENNKPVELVDEPEQIKKHDLTNSELEEINNNF